MNETTRLTAVLVAVLAMTAAWAVAPAWSDDSATTTTSESQTSYGGSLANGATWAAEVPEHWNGTLLLYGHGYRPTYAGIPHEPAIAPSDESAAALLAEGYALAGSSYAAPGWALETAPQDQLDTLSAVEQAIGRAPERVLAMGESMGGLVTAKLAEDGSDRIDGAVVACGIVGGALALNNYQLDGNHAINQLLAPGQNIRIARFADLGEAFASTGQLTAAVREAQRTPEGRARVALVAALYQAPSWTRDQPRPPAQHDPAAVQEGQYEWLLEMLGFLTPSDIDMVEAAGGYAWWNRGVDYGDLLRRSADRRTVRRLYAAAGLDLDADLQWLTATASIDADPGAVARMRDTSVPTGRLTMPVLTMHTTHDQLVPVQHQNAYADAVRTAGRNALLAQAYVARPGHCAFTPAEVVVAVQTLEQRVVSGRWGSSTQPQNLQAAARSSGLGEASFVRFRPDALLRATEDGR